MQFGIVVLLKMFGLGLLLGYRSVVVSLRALCNFSKF